MTWGARTWVTEDVSEVPRCIYCGDKTKGGRTCAAHSDLPRLDYLAIVRRRT